MKKNPRQNHNSNKHDCSNDEHDSKSVLTRKLKMWGRMKFVSDDRDSLFRSVRFANSIIVSIRQ